MPPNKTTVPRIADATWVLVHAHEGSFRDETERARLCANPAWRSFVTTGQDPVEVIEGAQFLDAAVVFAAPAPDAAWTVARRFQQRFPGRPTFLICEQVGPGDLAQATISGVTAVARDAGLRSVHAGLRYRLHGGVYHRVSHLIGDHDLSIRQYQCVLLAADKVPHADIALKLQIERSSVREHLREARRKIGPGTVDELLERTRTEARAEAAERLPR